MFLAPFAAQRRIVSAIQCRHFAGSAAEQLIKAPRPDTEQCLVRKTELGIRDQLEIHQLFQRRIMRRPDILNYNLFSFNRRGKSGRLNRIAIQKTLDRLASGGFR